jgi:hypothetical protein
MALAGGITPAKFPIGDEKTLDPKLTRYCAPPHWDPTMIFRRSVPGGMGTGSALPLPMDPRPWTKICLQYVNSGAAEPAPPVPSSLVIPGASEFYPPGRYSAAINNESLLRRLDRPLNEDLLPGPNSCFPEQYVLPATSDALQQYSLLPPQMPPKSKIVQGLQNPPVLDRNGQYKCSEEAMVCDLRGAPRFFNNHTKLTKYFQKDDTCGNMLWQTQNGKNPSPDNLPRPVPNDVY